MVIRKSPVLLGPTCLATAPRQRQGRAARLSAILPEHHVGGRGFPGEVRSMTQQVMKQVGTGEPTSASSEEDGEAGRGGGREIVGEAPVCVSASTHPCGGCGPGA